MLLFANSRNVMARLGTGTSRQLVRPPAISLLGNGQLDTLALWQANPRLLLANDENVALTGGEFVVNGILDVNDVEATIVTLPVRDHTDTAHVTTTSGHSNDTS